LCVLIFILDIDRFVLSFSFPGLFHHSCPDTENKSVGEKHPYNQESDVDMSGQETHQDSKLELYEDELPGGVEVGAQLQPVRLQFKHGDNKEDAAPCVNDHGCLRDVH